MQVVNAVPEDMRDGIVGARAVEDVREYPGADYVVDTTRHAAWFTLQGMQKMLERLGASCTSARAIFVGPGVRCVPHQSMLMVE